MSTVPTRPLADDASQTFVPPPYDHPHTRRQMDDLIRDVAARVAPVWPLKDYVAVNPYAGISERSFLDARSYLQVFSDCETLMPLAYYAQAYRLGQFDMADIETAIAELGQQDELAADDWSAEQIAWLLGETNDESATTVAEHDLPNQARVLRPLSDHVSQSVGIDWSEVICDEIGKHCSAHYDDGQAAWKSPWSDLPLYQAWRSAASIDRNVETLGLRGFRKFVACLPHSSDAAIVSLLQQAAIPERLWEAFLLCQAFSIPGWSAWTKFQSEWSDEVDHGDDFVGLLAIRLAYDVALIKSQNYEFDFGGLAHGETASFRHSTDDDSMLRLILLRASEIAYRSDLLQQLSTGSLASGPLIRGESNVANPVSDAPNHKEESSLPAVQMVFCIDVRSERIRRHLEASSPSIETLGFAGFFGMPIELASFGNTQLTSQLPVLLKPQYRIDEGLSGSGSDSESSAIAERITMRTWRQLWKRLQSSALGCFAFVETMGLFASAQLLSRTWGLRTTPDGRADGLAATEADALGPSLSCSLPMTDRVDLAASVLKGLGLNGRLARLVVLCGHACKTENNPMAAGLECGACGGHSGEPNARLAAQLLNDPQVRQALAERGVHVPDETVFVAGLHNTTTDAITFFDRESVPSSHQDDIDDLSNHAALAQLRTQDERMPGLGSHSRAELLRRSVDWSEVRPEWGLAGNAAFIAAPRSLTKGADMDGRTFLHSYDPSTDHDDSTLESIMTAPLVVAHWINMQYYASSVDNRHFGAGNKTLHNVVGRFGILSGNGGDLMTGLPWESLHTGRHFTHLPMRLQAIICASRDSIENVIQKHEMLGNLLNNGWMHVISIEDGTAYRYAGENRWQKCVSSPVDQPTAV